jgi:DNA/RNA endonuclease YhcR with UshA esterase domain
MRTLCCFLALLVVPALWADCGQDAKPLTPEEAAKHVNEKCTVVLEVKSTGASRDKSMIFLNSEANFRDAKNFTVVLDQKALEKFKKAKIDDPAAHFKGKTIHVTGMVTLFREHPQIKVEDADQVSVVEKKKERE